MNNLTKNCKITQVITPTAGAAGTTDIEGTVIDMLGFDSVTFICTFGAITSTAVTSIKAQQGAAADMSDAADLLGTAQTIADDDDGEVRFIEIFRPRERYVRLYVDRGTANAVVAAGIAIQRACIETPVAHGTGVEGELHISPAEGTA